MVLNTEQILSAVEKLDVAEREALFSALAQKYPRPDQAAFDAACVELAKHREALMEADPSRRRTLDQVLEAVTLKVAK
jgi:hypothetical protein